MSYLPAEAQRQIQLIDSIPDETIQKIIDNCYLRKSKNIFAKKDKIYRTNPEDIQRVMIYYKLHLNSKREYAMKYYYEKREECRDRRREYYHKHKEGILKAQTGRRRLAAVISEFMAIDVY